jgi:hypothetical protein
MGVATPAFGALLKIGDGATPENFVTAGEVMDINGPTTSVDTVETTSHSTSVPWETLVATIIRGGEVTFDINFDSTDPTHGDGVTGLQVDMHNRQLRNFLLILTDTGAEQMAFAAYVVGFPRNAPVAGVNRASVTLRISGQIVIT